jgi:hypothetical protein
LGTFSCTIYPKKIGSVLITYDWLRESDVNFNSSSVKITIIQ